MASQSILKCLGLHTAPSELTISDGTLVQADNVVIRNKDIIEPRPGRELYKAYTASAPQVMYFYENNLAVFTSNGSFIVDTGGALTAKSGTYTAPSASTLHNKAVEANQNLYFTTNAGVYRLDDSANTPAAAGGPKTADMQGTLATTGGSGFLADGDKVAYRLVFGLKDANGTLYLGPPSGRSFALNPAGTGHSVNVTVKFPVPSWVSTSNFYRVYRTEGVTAANIPDPGDEMGLVKEAYLSSSDISAREVSFTDTTPDDFRGTPLYTNPNSGDGILQSNEPPPMAWDLAHWQNRMWYANTTQYPRFYLDMIGVSGIAAGQTVTLSDGTTTKVFTVSAGPTYTNGEWALDGGSGAVQLENTARNLVYAINSFSTNTTWRAYYLSGPNDAPGKMMIESRTLGAHSFTVAISAGMRSSFNPDTSSSSANTSTNDNAPNRLCYSKIQQPEAVPLLNYLDVGSKNKDILRILPLRDKLYVFKEDEGVYVVSGEAPFRVDLLDDTVALIAPETAKVVNNQIYFLARQGVCAVSEGGVSVVSRQIDMELQSKLWGYRYSNRAQPFSVDWEPLGLYLLFIPSFSFSGTTYCDQAFVYNTRLGVWTKWILNASCAAMSPYTNSLYTAGAAQDTYLMSGSQLYTSQYNYDASASLTVSSASGTTLTFSGAHGAAVGDFIRLNSGGAEGLVTSVTSSTVLAVSAWAGGTGAATRYAAFQVTVKWAACTLGDPNALKQFREVNLHLKNHVFYRPTLTFETELSTSAATVPVVFPSAPGVTGKMWVDAINVHAQVPLEHRRVLVPQDKQRAAYLRVGFSIKEASSYFQIQGLSIVAEGTSERTNK